VGNWTQKYTKIYLFGSGGFIWSLFEPAPQSSLKLTCWLKFDEVKKVDMIFTWSKIRIYFLLPCQLKDLSCIKFNLLVDYFFKKKIFISFERMLIVIIKVLSFHVSTLNENCFADTQLSSTQRNKYQPMREQNWNKMTNLKPENWTHYHLFFRHLTLSRNNQSTHF